MAPIGTATGLAHGVASATARLPGHATTRLTDGAIAGRVASSWLSPVWGSSGLTVGNSRFVVLVSGDLSPREMVRVADSLKVDAQ